MLRPFVPKLTKSELHAVMTGGFATVSGSYIALLVEVGVGTCTRQSARHSVPPHLSGIESQV